MMIAALHKSHLTESDRDGNSSVDRSCAAAQKMTLHLYRTLPALPLSLPLAVVMVSLMGCDPGIRVPPCSVGADCASGVCQPDGRCAPQQDADAGLPEGDSGADLDAGMGADAGPRDSGLCQPNGDGVVARAEAPFGPGLTARYVSTTNVGVDTAGEDLGGGRRRWDLSGALPGDHDVDVITEPLDGRWFADRFPGADYVAPLSPEVDLLGVFRVGTSALELLGVVSPGDGATRTELSYAPPVRVLVFPLEAGLQWESDSRVSGLAEGLAVNYGERYESEVDGRGEIVTPYAPFEGLRVRTTLTRDFTFTRTVVRQFSFVAECFGSVATIVSEDDESGVEFSQASEIRRLGF